MRTQIAAKAKGVRVFAHRGDAESNVLFEKDAEFFGAFADIVARDSAGKRFILHALLHRIRFQIENAFRRADVGARG